MKKSPQVELDKEKLAKEERPLVLDQPERSLGSFEKWILAKTNAQENAKKILINPINNIIKELDEGSNFKQIEPELQSKNPCMIL